LQSFLRLDDALVPFIVDSPIIDLNQGNWHYNAQYFDASDPEERNIFQLTGSLTHFVNRYVL
jgi:hypothetical protein